MTVRYGLIGSGMMGREHIHNVTLLDGVEVSAVADPDQAMREKAAALAGGATSYADYRDLLSAGDFDALVIAAPNDTHHDILLDTITAGKPILCEKPLCTTTEDCRDVIAHAGRGAAPPIWVAMEYRYMPPLQRLRDELATGIAGDVKMISVREHRYPFLPKVGDWNRFNRRTGGTMVEKCCHFWDLMRLVLRSDPVRVYASAGIGHNHLDESYGGETPDIIDHGFSVVDFANGTRGMLDLCMFAEGARWQEEIVVTGTKARVEARVPRPGRYAPEDADHTAQVVVSERATQRERVEDVVVDEAVLAAGDHHGSTFFQHTRFLDLVRSGRTAPEVGLDDGMWAVRMGEAAEDSARTGRPVEFT